MKHIYLILFLGLPVLQGFTQTSIEKDFNCIFSNYGVDGCFVLYNQTSNEYIRYNPGLCDTGYIPASTFKIPHALIALEEKIIDTNQIIEWDGHEWPHKIWNQDQTLKSSIEYSCIWVYFGFAEQLGADTYHRYVDLFNYGNKNLTGPPTKFWLSGKFRISANQQVNFLRKFYNYDLPVSKNNINMIKKMIVIDKTENFILSGKTGGGILSDEKNIMWLVGYLEKNKQVYFFAMNFVTDDYNKTAKARYEITKTIFKELNLIE